MPERIQQSRAKGWRKPAGAVAVHRNTRWGNPYRTDDLPAAGRRSLADDREIVVRLFRELLDSPADRERAGYPSDAQIREQLGGKDLMCWCPLGGPCHADVLLEIANAEPGAIEHTVSTEPAPDSRIAAWHRAVCSCSWQSLPAPESVAQDLGAEHVANEAAR